MLSSAPIAALPMSEQGGHWNYGTLSCTHTNLTAAEQSWLVNCWWRVQTPAKGLK